MLIVEAHECEERRDDEEAAECCTGDFKWVVDEQPWRRPDGLIYFLLSTPSLVRSAPRPHSQPFQQAVSGRAASPASLRSDAIQLHSLYARWVSEETPNCGWRSSTLACLSLPISLHFSHHNGANVQPCGQLTARLRALCKLYDGETIVCFARRRNEVVLGRALLLTRIYDELLMINRVGDCIYCSPVGWCGGFLLHLYS